MYKSEYQTLGLMEGFGETSRPGALTALARRRVGSVPERAGLLARGEEFVLRAMVERDLVQVVELESSWAPVPWSHASFLHELRVPSSRASILCRKNAPDRVAGYLVRRLVAGD